MSVINTEIKMQGNDDAWFTTNATVVFPDNIQIFHNDGRYKFTDGVTTLSALPFLGQGNFTKQILSATSSTTPTFSVAGYDITYYDLTALAGNIASFGANITGPPPNKARLIVSFKDNGTARTLGFSTLFNFSTYLSAPVSTTIGKTLYLDCIYNSVTSKYDVLNWQDGY